MKFYLLLGPVKAETAAGWISYAISYAISYGPLITSLEILMLFKYVGMMIDCSVSHFAFSWGKAKLQSGSLIMALWGHNIPGFTD